MLLCAGRHTIQIWISVVCEMCRIADDQLVRAAGVAYAARIDVDRGLIVLVVERSDQVGRVGGAVHEVVVPNAGTESVVDILVIVAHVEDREPVTQFGALRERLLGDLIVIPIEPEFVPWSINVKP